MNSQNDQTATSVCVNRMVAVILDDVGSRPVPPGAETRLKEILQAISKGIASIDMAVDIIRLFPDAKAA